MTLQELFIPIDDPIKVEQFFSSLPLKPQTYWYVSAGTDFRGPVYLSDYNIDRQMKNHKRKLKKPDLYLFNCLGGEVKKLEEELKKSKDDLILFEDDFTIIKAIQYIPTKIDRDRINYHISSECIERNHVQDPLRYQENDAFLLTIKIKSLSDNFEEEAKIIYLQMENINCFEEVILQNSFIIQYLCATREGMAWGNCKQSIITKIYNSENHYENRGFDPDYVITFDDFTNLDFLNRMAANGRKLKELAPLPFENKEQLAKNNHVYQIIKNEQ